MPVFKIKVIKDCLLDQNQLKKDMNVELFCPYTSPINNHGIYIYKAFMRKYNLELKGYVWNTSEFLEIAELETSTLENLIKEIELIKIEQADLAIAQRYEELTMVRDMEKNVLQKIETQKNIIEKTNKKIEEE